MSDSRTNDVIKTGLGGIAKMAIGGIFLGPVALTAGLIWGVSEMTGALMAGEEGAKAIKTIHTATNIGCAVDSLHKK